MSDNVIVRVPEQQFIRGEDGYSPEVTIENIEHGHSVTITDRDHPEGQSFNVMDGDSAYEQAVAGGYTGTEAQFNEELASFKELSEQAADSASAAAQSESNAAGSATTATTKAQEAADSAAQALIRMNSAGTSAQAAEDASSFFTSTILPNAVTTINNAKDQAVSNVNVAKSTAVQNVQAEGTTQISALQTESTTQQAAIQQKGEDVLDSIPSDYTELTEDVDELKSAINDADPLYNKIISLPDSNSFFNKGSSTGTGTYTKLSAHALQISGGSGSTYYSYPIHGTNRVVSGTNAQLVTRVLPEDFLEIPDGGSWGSNSYSLGIRFYCETTSSASGKNLDLLVLCANIVDGAFVSTPVIVSYNVVSTQYGSNVVRLRGLGFAPFENYTHYAIFVRTRNRASGQTSKIYMETVQSPRYLTAILSPDSAIETTTTASRAHAVNSYIILNDSLYKVTSAISAGDDITAGTNVTQTSILEQLEILAEKIAILG